MDALHFVLLSCVVLQMISIFEVLRALKRVTMALTKSTSLVEEYRANLTRRRVKSGPGKVRRRPGDGILDSEVIG